MLNLPKQIDSRIPFLGVHITITEWGLGMANDSKTPKTPNRVIEAWVRTWLPRASVILMDESRIVGQDEYFDWAKHPTQGEGELDLPKL